jgi:hypothetical protein
MKIKLLLEGESTVNEAQADPQTAGHVLSSQAPHNEHHDILGESIAPRRVNRPKTNGVLELWHARTLPG